MSRVRIVLPVTSAHPDALGSAVRTETVAYIKLEWERRGTVASGCASGASGDVLFRFERVEWT